jgi:hypothetical protein
MRQELLLALQQYFNSHINKHRMNVEVMLNNPMAIHEHTDIMAALEKEIHTMSEFKDKLEVLEAYFKEKEFYHDTK